MKITLIVVVILLLFSLFYFFKNKKTTKNDKMETPTDAPIVKNLTDVKNNTDSIVYVLGKYQLQDIRMRQENPKVVHRGHAGIVLEDGHCVLLMPPNDEKAIRSKKEQNKCTGKYVYAKGRIYPYIPQEGAAMRSPCLTEISDIQLTSL